MRVGIHLSPNPDSFRPVIKGIARFIRDEGTGSITPLPHLFDTRYILNSGLDGLIALLSPEYVEEIPSLPLPVVNLYRHDQPPHFAELWTDYKDMTHQALDHLRERGCWRVAIINTADRGQVYLNQKEENLREAVQEYGMEIVGCFKEDLKYLWPMEAHFQNLTDWLQALPKPLGIVCTYDAQAIRVLQCLRRLNVRVPGEVLLLSLSNDSILLECSQPRITGVDFNYEAKGYRAAEILADLIAGRRQMPCREILPTRGIIPRDSTAFSAPDDAQLQKAIEAMRDWEYALPALDTIALRAGMSRSTLTRRLRQRTGHTPGELLLRIRLEKALEQLRTSSESLAEITDVCGYGLSSQLSREVRIKTGMTPSQYRTYWQSQ